MEGRWRVVFTRNAERALDTLPAPVRERILLALDRLSDDPLRAPNVKRLSGRDEYRLRVGDHRILYELDGEVLVVRVLHAGHRREVYR